MSCMLRIWGADLAIDELLAEVGLEATAVFRKGTPRFGARRGKHRVYSGSGANIQVSNADFCGFERSLRETIQFLREKEEVLQRLMNWPGLESGLLDFGVARETRYPIQCETFPAELVALAGKLGWKSRSLISRSEDADGNSRNRRLFLLACSQSGMEGEGIWGTDFVRV